MTIQNKIKTLEMLAKGFTIIGLASCITLLGASTHKKGITKPDHDNLNQALIAGQVYKYPEYQEYITSESQKLYNQLLDNSITYSQFNEKMILQKNI